VSNHKQPYYFFGKYLLYIEQNMRFFQFLLGFAIGLTLFIGGVAGIGYYFLKNMLQSPTKPTFAEEKPKEQPKATNQKTAQKTTKKETVTMPTPTVKAEDKLPQGAYKAKVTWSGGLSLRSEPSTDSERVGGLDYNRELVVLQTSGDGKWQKIRTVDGNLEGWIKAGNVKRNEL
jgi:Bacterial SH3 domain